NFKDYKILNAENEIAAVYDGNQLTGVAPLVLSAGVDLETTVGLYFYGSYFYSDRLPLDDKNSNYNSSYHLADSKMGYKVNLGKSFLIDVYGGLNNILDQKYSSIVSLNAANYGGGAAYYNPSPRRN